MAISQQTLEALSNNDPTLRALNLSCQNLTDEDIEVLCEALKNNTYLTELNIRGNKIGDAGAKALAKNTTITQLFIYSNKLSAAGAKALAKNTTIARLDIRGNQIGAAGAEALAQNTTIAQLDISDNEIGAAGAKALAKNTTIARLDIRGNQIGAAGAEALAQNTTIFELDISGNDIGDAGAEALAQNTTITHLDISDNKISDAGAKAIAQNTTITELNIYDNAINDAVVRKELQIALDRNRRSALKKQLTNAMVTLCQPVKSKDEHKASFSFPQEILLHIYQYMDVRGLDPFKLMLAGVLIVDNMFNKRPKYQEAIKKNNSSNNNASLTTPKHWWAHEADQNQFNKAKSLSGPTANINKYKFINGLLPVFCVDPNAIQKHRLRVSQGSKSWSMFSAKKEPIPTPAFFTGKLLAIYDALLEHNAELKAGEKLKGHYKRREEHFIKLLEKLASAKPGDSYLTLFKDALANTQGTRAWTSKNYMPLLKEITAALAQDETYFQEGFASFCSQFRYENKEKPKALANSLLAIIDKCSTQVPVLNYIT
jgi:Leucine-rich repeat (LRR) protein